MKPATAKLWQTQNRHPGDRCRLFRAVASVTPARRVLYPGSYVDVAASCVFAQVTYVDMDRRAAAFFKDVAGVREIIATCATAPSDPVFSFIHGDYTKVFLPAQTFDLLISLYAGFISEACGDSLRIGGTLLVNPSHGDAALAALDPRFKLSGVVLSQTGDYRVRTTGLEEYMIPKQPRNATYDKIRAAGRGVSYTRAAFAYMFTRVA